MARQRDENPIPLALALPIALVVIGGFWSLVFVVLEALGVMAGGR